MLANKAQDRETREVGDKTRKKGMKKEQKETKMGFRERTDGDGADKWQYLGKIQRLSCVALVYLELKQISDTSSFLLVPFTLCYP